jgi:uncharacterized protein YjdB
MTQPQRPHSTSRCKAVSSTLRVVVPLIGVLLMAQTAHSQSAPKYTITQITNDPTNHESPSINDRGQIVWSRQVPVGSALLWQVYERDIRINGSPVLVTAPGPNNPNFDQNHDFQYPVIDNAGDIVYLKDQVGGGVALEVVENKAGSETIIEFSSIDPNSGAARVAGKHFGISSNGTIISYFDFCLQTCTQTFDVSGQPSIAGNLIQYFVPDINDYSTFAFVYNHQVCTASTSNPTGLTCIGPGDLPHITNPQLHSNGGKTVADPEVVYINAGQVISTFGGVIDSGSWAGVNNLGMIVYEKPDSSGFNQIFLATPYWQQCHGKNPTTGKGHWGGEVYAFHDPNANPPITMCTYGCLTTALSRVLALGGVTTMPTSQGIVGNDPGNLNMFMKEQPLGQDYDANNDANAPNTTTDVARSAGVLNVTWCTQLPVQFPLQVPLQCSNSGRNIVGEVGVKIGPINQGPSAVADLEAIVSQGQRPAIVKVASRTHPNTPNAFHFVAVIGVVTVTGPTCSSYFDGHSCVDFLISDPYGSPSIDPTGTPPNILLNTPDMLPYTMLGQYGTFSIYGFVTDPPDSSRLDIAVGDSVSLLVVDAAGRRTGLDPSTGAILNEIPGSAYFDTSVDDEDTVDPGHVFGPPTPVTHQVDIFNPLQGAYTVTLSGVQTGSYVLALTAFSQDGSAQPLRVLRGNANPGSTSSTTVQFSPAPNSTLVLSGLAAPIVRVTAGTFAYDGAAHGATANAIGVSGAPVSGSFTFTYTPGGATPPVNVGMYSVTAQFTSNDPNYTNASNTGTITITPAIPTQTVSSTGSMQFARVSHQATVLADGLVLVSGGQSGGTAIAQAELFNPATGKWTPTQSNIIPRFDHTATLLQDGRVLAAGGVSSNGDCSSNVTAETYDPASGTWSLTGRMPSPVGTGHIAMRLLDGRVLVSGGGDRCGAVFNTAAVFDPSTNKWSAARSMTAAREFHSAALLPDGRVLVAGGVTASSSPAVASAEIYDPVANTWTAVATMGTARQTSCNGYAQPYLATLSGGTVLAAGGFSGANCSSITPARTVSSLTVNPSPAQLSNTGATQALSVTAHMSDGSTQLFTGPLQFSSANTTIAKVDSNGLITGVGAGTTTITVTVSGIAPVPVTTTVATRSLTSISVSPPSITMIGSGQTQPLTINGVFSDGSQQALTTGVTFVSSNTAVASVDQTGLVTSIANGTATISVTAQGAPAVQIPVSVKSLVSIAVSPTSITLTALGQVQPLAVTGLFSDGSQQILTNSVSFISSNPAVARVDLSGNITAISMGTATITVSLPNVAAVQVPVTVAPTPVVLFANPNSGLQGQQNLSVSVTGQFTNWVQGTTTASFGPGITVAALTVNSSTTATASLNIDPAATQGPRTITFTTGTEIATRANSFTVLAQTGVLVSVNPPTGQLGQQNLSVSLTGQFTNWVQGTTIASFGAGITVSSLTVNSPTSATAVLTIDPAATTGPRTVTLTTGSEIESLGNGFVVSGGPREADAKPFSVLNLAGVTGGQPISFEADAKTFSVLNTSGAGGTGGGQSSEADAVDFSVLNLAGMTGGKPVPMEADAVPFSVLNTAGPGGTGGGSGSLFEVDAWIFSTLNLAGVNGGQPVQMEADGVPFSVMNGTGPVPHAVPINPNQTAQTKVTPKGAGTSGKTGQDSGGTNSSSSTEKDKQQRQK